MKTSVKKISIVATIVLSIAMSVIYLGGPAGAEESAVAVFHVA